MECPLWARSTTGLSNCNGRSPTCWSVFDLTQLEREVADLERRSTAPGFWDDSNAARSHMQRLATRKGTVDTWRGLERRVADALELLQLAEDEDDTSVSAEVAADFAVIRATFDQEEFELSFAGEYDDRNAIMQLFAGAGGIDSQDWAEMLERMYLRWGERRGFKATIVDRTLGEEAGIKNSTIEFEGPHAYGWLHGERGVHRLVRLSPYDGQHNRHTSFALVEIMPEVESEAEVEIDPDDLRIDVFRASGHGGQNVQKNSTAVRITHRPSGVVVACQNERSLHRNRESAMRVLESRLLQLEVQRLEEERAKLRGEPIEAGWGNQIRSYVLHPYKMIKDLRTGQETSDPESVLDGDLDAFLKAYLKMQIGQAGVESAAT